MSKATYSLAQQLGERLLARGWVVGTAESCTGGLLAAAITDIPGSSLWFQEGLVTYANSSKQRLLDVAADNLARFGAVSQQVVESMAAGVLARGADVAIATSGIAGPDGGSADKPVGTVWLGWGFEGRVYSARHSIQGDRQMVRERATVEALQGLLSLLNPG